MYINNTLIYILFGGSVVIFIDSISYPVWNENFFQLVPLLSELSCISTNNTIF